MLHVKWKNEQSFKYYLQNECLYLYQCIKTRVLRTSIFVHGDDYKAWTNRLLLVLPVSNKEMPSNVIFRKRGRPSTYSRNVIKS